MTDDEIDYTDIPALGSEFFKNAILWPGTKRQITLRLDPDVLAFFRKQGKRYQTMINAVLRRYMEAQSEKGSSQRRVRRRGQSGNSSGIPSVHREASRLRGRST